MYSTDKLKTELLGFGIDLGNRDRLAEPRTYLCTHSKSLLIIDGDVGAKDLSRYTGRLCDKDVLSVQGVNVYDILKRDQLVITSSALKTLEERLK